MIFISRAGSDAAVAELVARILEDAGYTVILQQWNFPNRSFIAEMHEALAGGARVLALLSPDYFRSDGCAAEWMNVLASDPLNREGRLIVMRVAECQPLGLLTGLWYWDLVPLLGDPSRLADVVREALRMDHRTPAVISGPYRRAPVAIADPSAIRLTSSFTGRTGELETIQQGLWGPDNRLIVHGPAGTGKSTLAHEYARRSRERYLAIGWLAAKSPIGIADGLIWLGAQLIRGLDEIKDRNEAARQALSLLVRLGTADRPVLLIFDNLEERRLLHEWAPDGLHVLVTTRIAGWGRRVPRVRLDVWPRDDAASYLLLESGRDDLTASDAETISSSLGFLPLAIAHAAAYLRSTITITAADYLERLDARMKYAPEDAEYPKSVYATVHESVAKAEELRPGAAALLCLAAFFDPAAIPVELVRQRPEAYPESLHPSVPRIARCPLDLRGAVAAGTADDALSVLHRLSLIEFTVESATFSVHRLVQLAGRDLVGHAIIEWSWAAIAVIESAFPGVNFETWPACERLILHARAALAALPAQAELPRAARVASRCGQYLTERAAYAQAEALFRRALEIDESSYGPDDRRVATDLNNLALVLRETNRPNDAEPLFRRALMLHEACHGPTHRDVAMVLVNLAGLLKMTNRLSEAEALYRRALAIDEERDDDLEVATDLNNLGGLLRMMNRLPEAERLYRRALEIKQRRYGEVHPAIGTAYNNLAELLRLNHRIEEAEDLFRRALAIQETAYGPDHPEVSIVLNNLAGLLGETNRRAEAETLYRRSIAIAELYHGTDHPKLAKRLGNLALLLRETNRISEAEDLYRRALTIDETSLGPGHPEVATDLGNLAGVLRVTGRAAEAETLYRRALAIDERTFGRVHPEVAADLNNLAVLLRETGRAGEAERLCREALEVDEATFGPAHPKVALRLCNLSLVLYDTGRFAEAEAALRRALAIDEAAKGPDHPRVATDLNNLASMLFKLRRPAESVPLLRRALAIDEAHYGSDHCEAHIVRKNLAHVLRSMNRTQEADAMLARAVAHADPAPDAPRSG